MCYVQHFVRLILFIDDSVVIVCFSDEVSRRNALKTRHRATKVWSPMNNGRIKSRERKRQP